jgi:hypothetical protein
MAIHERCICGHERCDHQGMTAGCVVMGPELCPCQKFHADDPSEDICCCGHARNVHDDDLSCLQLGCRCGLFGGNSELCRCGHQRRDHDGSAHADYCHRRGEGDRLCGCGRFEPPDQYVTETLPARNAQTPGPWELRTFDDAQMCLLGPQDKNHRQELIGTINLMNPCGQGNAAFILRACNAHPRMVRLLERVAVTFKHYAADHDRKMHLGRVDSGPKAQRNWELADEIEKLLGEVR